MGRERDRHKLPRDLDFTKLRDQLSLRLGRPVEVVARPPGAHGDGELVVTDPDTGEWLKVDPTVVAAAVAVTPDVPTPRTSEQKLLSDLTEAVGVDAQLTAVRNFLVRAVESELTIRERAGGPLDVPERATEQGDHSTALEPADLDPRHLLTPWDGLQLRPVQRPR